MNKWTRPSCYCGASWPEWYVFLWQNRDGDAVTRSNFRVGLERLGGRVRHGKGDTGEALDCWLGGVDRHT